jgi:hypothetical protein
MNLQPCSLMRSICRWVSDLLLLSYGGPSALMCLAMAYYLADAPRIIALVSHKRPTSCQDILVSLHPLPSTIHRLVPRVRQNLTSLTSSINHHPASSPPPAKYENGCGHPRLCLRDFRLLLLHLCTQPHLAALPYPLTPPGLDE